MVNRIAAEVCSWFPRWILNAAKKQAWEESAYRVWGILETAVAYKIKRATR